MLSIGVLPPAGKEKQRNTGVRTRRAVARSAIGGIAFAVAVIFFAAPAMAAGGIELGTGREARIGTDPATDDRIMATPPPAAPQPQDQGPQTVIVSPEIDLRRPGYGPTPPRPYPPGPRPYGPQGPGAPYPAPRGGAR